MVEDGVAWTGFHIATAKPPTTPSQEGAQLLLGWFHRRCWTVQADVGDSARGSSDKQTAPTLRASRRDGSTHAQSTPAPQQR